MNSPNESIPTSAMADEDSVDIDAAALPPLDFHQTVADHPMTSALVAAAAGAAMMALVTLSMRGGGSRVEALPKSEPVSVPLPVPDVATRDDLADLRNQLSRWIQDLTDATPSRRDVKRNIEDASDSVVNTWNDVRDQATELAQRVRSQVVDTADRLRPKVNAAVDLAKDNPMWLGVAIAALGAVVGASAGASSRK